MPHIRVHFIDAFEQPDALAQDLSRCRRHADALRVDAPNFYRVHIEHFRDQVHVLLDGERALRHAEAAKRARRRIIRIHRVAVNLGVRHDVGSRRVGGGARHDLIRQAGIRAAVAVQFRFNRGQRAVTFRARLDADHGRMTLGMEQQGFGTRIEHFDRASSDLRQHGDVNLSGDILFAAETAANQHAAHADRFVGDCHRTRDLVAILIRNLRSHVNG